MGIVNLLCIIIINQYWPTFMHDPQHTGRQENLKGCFDSLYLKWSQPIPVRHSTPTIANIDTDTVIEVVVASEFGIVYALKGTDGSIKWSRRPGGTGNGSNELWTTPAIGDIDKDGEIEIVVGSIASDKSVFALKGSDGSTKWSRTLGDWVRYGATIGDIDGDTNTIEVLVGSEDSSVYALRGTDGSILWSYKTGPSVYGVICSPAFADIDGNGEIEVVFGACDSCVYAVRGINGGLRWQRKLSGDVGSSVSIGDIDANGSIEVAAVDVNGIVYLLDGVDGSIKWQKDVGGFSGIVIYNTPALGNMDTDPYLELVIANYDYEVYVLDGNTGNIQWTKKMDDTSAMVLTTSAVADIEGDGKLEIVIGNHYGKFYAFEGENGNVKWNYGAYTDDEGGNAIGDIDNDGYMEIVGAGYGLGFMNDVVFALDCVPPAGVMEDKKQGVQEKIDLIIDNHQLIISFAVPVFCDNSVSILDITGRERVHKELGKLDKGKHRLLIDIGKLSNGVYLLRLNTGSTARTQKFYIIK